MAKGTALAQDQLSALADIVGPDRVLAGPEASEQYGRDWTRAHAPAPCAVVLPGSIGEVQAVVRYARRAGLAIVPSGGRTGRASFRVVNRRLVWRLASWRVPCPRPWCILAR